MHGPQYLFSCSANIPYAIRSTPRASSGRIGFATADDGHTHQMVFWQGTLAIETIIVTK
jgi:hypothetical protein